MNGLLERWEPCSGEPVLKRNEVRLADVLDRLEAGEAPDRVGEALGLDAIEVVSGLALAGLGAGEFDGPALVQSEPRRPRLVEALAEPSLARLFPGSTRPARLALSAGLRQVLDFWEASHHAAQEADDLGERSVSAYWHGIAHRREPDAGNAAYWFRRVGRHPLFDPLSRAVLPILDELDDPGIAGRLVRDGVWDPFAMIALSDGARPGSTVAALAGRIQRREMVLLMEATVEAVR